MLAISMANQARLAANPKVMRWMSASRLDPRTALVMAVGEADSQRKAQVELSRAKTRAAAAALPKLLERIGL